MPKPPDLLIQAADFANGSLATLLNGTITKGIRISAALQQDGRCLVGYKVGKNNFIPGAIPVTTSKAQPCCYLDLMHTLFLTERHDLAVATSRYALYLNAEDEEPLFHYDYERNKETYPVAHFQIAVESEAWKEFFGRSDRSGHMQVESLHLPVGGKRYRPSLEDLVEFLILEKFCEPHGGYEAETWKPVVAQHREEFHRLQLAAAIYGDPETARATLAKYDEEHPPE